MRMKAGSTVQTLGVLFVLFVLYVVAVLHYRSRFAPAPSVRTFADLQHQGVPLNQAVALPRFEGHVCVFADASSLWWTLYSGPPAYHFDASGRLIDFTLDVGDSTKFQKDYGVYRGTKVEVSGLPARFLQQAAR